MVWNRGILPGGGGGGTGDVVGPAGAVDLHLAVFDGVTGKLIKDGGPIPVGGGDVVGPGSAVNSNFAQFDTTTGKLIKDGGLSLDTDTALTANSNTRIASQAAVKSYADALIGAANAVTYKGVIDASTNPNYPAADAGWTYLISVAGKIGGASGVNVEVGDMIICTTDGTASGDQATVGSFWNVIQKNLDGAVIGPASSVDSHVALFDGVTGKLLKDGGVLPTTVTPGGATTNVQYNNAGAFAGEAGFTWTSATNTLGVGEAASATGKINLLGTTSGAVTLSVADAAGTWTFKFPTTAGTTGQALTTDGSGNTTWTTISGGGGSGGSNSIADGRLTLTSGVPILSSDTLAATTLYYTPYLGNNISLYNGSTWDTIAFSEVSLSLSGFTANTNYDIFGYNNAGTLTLEATAWTNDTTRATALVRQNGVWSKTGALTRRYLGTIRTTATIGQTEWHFGRGSSGPIKARFLVYNQYNKVKFSCQVVDDTPGGWTYSGTSFRNVNANANNRLDFVVGDPEYNQAFAQYTNYCINTTSAASIAIEFGSGNISTRSATSINVHAQLTATVSGKLPAVGFDYIQALEAVNGGTGTFYAASTYVTTLLNVGMEM